jgi:mannose-6-phosphate isomerase
MEALMEWVPVSVGDMLFVDAGTVHAIGPGVVLLETQQTSDVTYRLYDYGRPRELHLEKGLQVMKPKTGAGKVAAKTMDGFTRLIEQKYFAVDRFDFGQVTEASVSFDGPGCLVGLAGRAVISTAGGDVVLTPGQAVVAPVKGDGAIVDTDTGVSFLRCVAPVR